MSSTIMRSASLKSGRSPCTRELQEVPAITVDYLVRRESAKLGLMSKLRQSGALSREDDGDSFPQFSRTWHGDSDVNLDLLKPHHSNDSTRLFKALPQDMVLKHHSVISDTPENNENLQFNVNQNDKNSITVHDSELLELNLGVTNKSHGTLKSTGSIRHKRTIQVELAPNSHVWLVHRSGFSPVFLSDSSCPSNKCFVHLQYGTVQVEVNKNDLELANPAEFDRIENLSGLLHINESSALHTLTMRYTSNLIHSYAGRTLVIMKPIKPLPALYSNKVVALFRGCNADDMPPHIFSVAQNAYRDMIETRADQSIVLKGWSGSGKTTNLQHLLRYFATSIGSVDNIVTADRCCAVMTLLEAFGCSRTISGSSSSRCSTSVMMSFNQSGQITGMNIHASMLDRQRILHRPQGEATFNIFYHMFAGLNNDERNELLLVEGPEPNLLWTTARRQDDVDRAKLKWKEIQTAMSILSLSPSQMQAICSVLAVICHLGVAGVRKENDRWTFSRPNVAHRAAVLLGTTLQQLSDTIFQRTTCTNKESCLSNSGSGWTGLEFLEHFISHLYSQLFNYLVAVINGCLEGSNAAFNIIMLDSAGSQNPALYGRSTGATLDDLFRNYLADRLQQLHHRINISNPYQLCIDNGIHLDWNDASSSIDSEIELIEHTLFKLLDQSSLQGGSDETLVKSFLQQTEGSKDSNIVAGTDHECMISTSHLNRTLSVTYNVKGWLKLIRQSSEMSSLQLARCNKCEMQKLLMTVPSKPLNGGQVQLTLIAQIKSSVDDLISQLSKTKIHFVECLLPHQRAIELNGYMRDILPSRILKILALTSGGEEKPINVPLLRQQLRGAELISDANLYKLGYAVQLTYADFRRRYESLVPPDQRPKCSDDKQAVQELMKLLNMNPNDFQLSNNQVFLRDGSLAILNDTKDAQVSDWLVRLQSRCRAWLVRHKLPNHKRTLSPINQQSVPVNQTERRLRWTEGTDETDNARELNQLQTKYNDLLMQHDNVVKRNYQLLQDKLDEEDDADNDHNLTYDRQSRENTKRQVEAVKRKLQAQHDDELEMLSETKKQISKQLTEARDEADGQRALVTSLTQKSDQILRNMADAQARLDKQLSVNGELEKKQRKLEAELQRSAEIAKVEKQKAEKCQLEKVTVEAERYNVEKQLKDVEADLQLEIEKRKHIEEELEYMTVAANEGKQIAHLKRLKAELEVKCQTQEEELDECETSIRDLKQAKSQLEATVEKLKAKELKEQQLKADEIDEIKAFHQKKLKAMEQESSELQENNSAILKEKTDLEKQLKLISTNRNHSNKAVVQRLRRKLKKTKALLLHVQRNSKTSEQALQQCRQIKQLRANLEESELTSSIAARVKTTLEHDVEHLQSQLDLMVNIKLDAEQRCHRVNEEKTELECRLNDNEDELNDVLKKYKALVQQNSFDLARLDEQIALTEELQVQIDRQKEESDSLRSRLRFHQEMSVSRQIVVRLEARIAELELVGESEVANNTRLQAKISRAKTQLATERAENTRLRSADSEALQVNKTLSRQLRDMQEQLKLIQRTEADLALRNQQLENRIHSYEVECEQYVSQLQLSTKRITELQKRFDRDASDDFNSDDDSDDYYDYQQPQAASSLDISPKRSLQTFSEV